MKEKVDSLIQFIQFNYLSISKENKLPVALSKNIE